MIKKFLFSISEEKKEINKIKLILTNPNNNATLIWQPHRPHNKFTRHFA
jgi:hypothetical protein